VSVGVPARAFNARSKGALVAVEGRLQTRQWDDELGHRHWKTEVVASSIEMLSGRQTRDCAAQVAADDELAAGEWFARALAEHAFDHLATEPVISFIERVTSPLPTPLRSRGSSNGSHGHDPAVTELVRSVAVELLGDAQILTMAAPDMGAEDWSYMILKAARRDCLPRRPGVEVNDVLP